MTDDTIREFEAPDTYDVERFAEFRSTLLEKFRVSDEHATRLAFALSERHPTLVARDLTATQVDALLSELAQDHKLEAELSKRTRN